MAGFGTTPGSNTFFEKGMEEHWRMTGQLDEGNQPVLFDVAWEVRVNSILPSPPTTLSTHNQLNNKSFKSSDNH